MAGRYVILEFEDGDAANAFVTNPHLPGVHGLEVKAMYIKPTKFCQCDDKRRQDNRNWKKNKKYGLFVCRRCGRPSVFHEKGIVERLKFVFGFNLMEQ